jgi:hypothetical protein
LAADRGFLVHVLALAVLIGTGLAVYGAVVLATGAISLRQLGKLVRRS